MEKINEAPHIMTDVECPRCGQYQSVTDFRIEDWDEPMTFKQYYLRRLLKDKEIPTVCPRCDKVFNVDKETRETGKVKMRNKGTKELMKNKDLVVSQIY